MNALALFEMASGPKAPTPDALIAATRNVDGTPAAYGKERDVVRERVFPTTSLHEAPSSVDTSMRYPETRFPPSSSGAFHCSETRWALPVARTPAMGPGAVSGFGAITMRITRVTRFPAASVAATVMF